MSYALDLQALVAAHDTRFVLARAALEFAKMDPVDALDDCERLVALMRIRLTEAMRDAQEARQSRLALL